MSLKSIINKTNANLNYKFNKMTGRPVFSRPIPFAQIGIGAGVGAGAGTGIALAKVAKKILKEKASKKAAEVLLAAELAAQEAAKEAARQKTISGKTQKLLSNAKKYISDERNLPEIAMGGGLGALGTSMFLNRND